MSRDSLQPSFGDGSRVSSRRFCEFELVSLREDMPEEGLKRGECGTIVETFFDDQDDAYLVEFVNPADGSTRALVELAPEHIALADPHSTKA